MGRNISADHAAVGAIKPEGRRPPMMNDGTVSLRCVFASILWALAVLLVVGSGILRATIEGPAGEGWSMVLIGLGILVGAAATAATVRNGLSRQNALLEDAFKLGHEAATLRRVN